MKSTPKDSRICASTKCPMRTFAMTGMLTIAWMPSIISGSLIRATPPSRRMSAGTRSRAMTAHAPESSAIFACSGVTTSMMTPPFSISARPRFTRIVPEGEVGEDMYLSYRARRAVSYGNLIFAGSDPAGMSAPLLRRGISTHVLPGVSLMGAPAVSVRVKTSVARARAHFPFTSEPLV